MMCKLLTAAKHQIWYAKRLNSVVVVHLLSLVLGCVVNPWFLNAKCGHRFDKKLTQNRVWTRPVHLDAHCY